MPLWQRLLITLLAIIGASLVAGLVWEGLSGYQLPGYIAGVIGGLTALPVWEFLKRVRPKPESGHV